MKKKIATAFIIILILQLVMFGSVCVMKQGYHIDEVYSYILSNSYNADKLANAENFWGQWVKGEELTDFIRVNQNERFAYDKVYFNNSTDAHPPLFYWFLHTVSSFFPGVFSKWLGLSLNLLYFVFIQILLYFVSKKFLRSEKMSLLAVTAYGFSLFAIDTVTFIRMYALMTVFVLLLVLLCFEIIEKGADFKRIFLLFLTVYLGSMTQYYFIVFAFFAIALLCIYYIKNKKLKELFLVGGAAFLAVVLMFISYPYAISQATGSETNNVGNEVVRSLFNFRLWMRMAKSMFLTILFRLSANKAVSLILFVLIIAGFALWLYKSAKNKTKIKLRYVYLASVSALTFLAVTYIGGKYVYLRYLYYIMPLVYILLVVPFNELLKNKEKVAGAVLIIALVFFVNNAYFSVRSNMPKHLYNNIPAKEKIMEQSDKPLIFVTGEKVSPIATLNLQLMIEYNSVYVSAYDDISKTDVIEKCIDENASCVCFIESGIEENEISELFKGFNYKELGGSVDYFGNYYLLTKGV